MLRLTLLDAKGSEEQRDFHAHFVFQSVALTIPAPKGQADKCSPQVQAYSWWAWAPEHLPTAVTWSHYFFLNHLSILEAACHPVMQHLRQPRPDSKVVPELTIMSHVPPTVA